MLNAFAVSLTATTKRCSFAKNLVENYNFLSLEIKLLQTSFLFLSVLTDEPLCCSI